MCVWSQKISYRKIQERPHLWSNFGGGGKSRQEKSADWNLSSKHPLQDVRSTGSRVSNAVETLSKKIRLREANSVSLTPQSCVFVFFFFQERGKGSGHMEGLSTEGMKPGQEVRVPHWTCHRPNMGFSLVHLAQPYNLRGLASTFHPIGPILPGCGRHSPLLHEFPDRGYCGARSQVSVIWAFIFLHYLFCRNTKSKHYLETIKATLIQKKANH